MRCYEWSWYSLGKVILLNPQSERGGAKNSGPFIVICPALTFFSEKVFQIFLNEFSVISQIFSVTLLGIVLIMSSAK